MRFLAAVGLLIALFSMGGVKFVTKFISPYFAEASGYILEKNDLVPVSSLAAPEDIAPLWYFSPSYAILRVIPDKFFAQVEMFISLILILLFVLMNAVFVLSYRFSKGIYVNKVVYRLFKYSSSLFVATLLGLAWLAYSNATDAVLLSSKLLTVLCFGSAILMPVPVTLKCDSSEQVKQ